MTGRRTLSDLRPRTTEGQSVAESWELTTLNRGDVINDLQLPSETVFVRSDGQGLFYDGRSHYLYGPSETLKSWIALMMVRDVVMCGPDRGVLFLDYEHAGKSEIAYRLTLLGVPEDRLNQVRYLAPEGPPDPRIWGGVIDQLWDPPIARLVVIDSVGGALAEMGRSGQTTEDFTTWHKIMIAPILRVVECGVVAVDHAPLTAKPGRGVGPIGSQTKRANLTGAGYQVRPVVPLRPGIVGVVDLYIEKDKSGRVREHCGPRLPDGTQHAARITLDASDPEKIITAIDPPPPAGESTGPRGADDAVASRNQIKQQVCQVVADAVDPPSQNDLVQVTRMDRGAAIALIRELVDDGYLGTKPGKNRAKLHVLLRPFANTTGGPSS